ncbi:MAG: hypothetical protein M3447_10215 [Acidobacteriota bacterium]|nr:hypothetical protein [Acidobacteriota bacterium]
MSVILSILALRAQEVTPAPLGSFVDHFTQVLLPMDPPGFQPFLTTFFADHARQWRLVISEVKDSNKTKAQFLWRAQLFLITAIFAVGALSLSKLIQ